MAVFTSANLFQNRDEVGESRDNCPIIQTVAVKGLMKTTSVALIKKKKKSKPKALPEMKRFSAFKQVGGRIEENQLPCMWWECPSELAPSCRLTDDVSG